MDDVLEAVRSIADAHGMVVEADADRIRACLAEVAPALIPRVTIYDCDGILALGTDMPSSESEAVLILKAHSIAMPGRPVSCVDCFLACRGPLCAAGDCTEGEDPEGVNAPRAG